MIPTMLGITLVTFFMIKLAPGDPITMKLNLEGLAKSEEVSPEVIKMMRRQYGLDTPLPTHYDRFIKNLKPQWVAKASRWFGENAIQYRKWLLRIAVFDFGRSLKPDRRPVVDKIREALPVTLTLNILDIIIVYMVSVLLGVYSALNRNTLKDKIMMVGMFVLYSLPSFWIAILLLMYFAGGEHFSWFPLGGFLSDGMDTAAWYAKAGNIAWHLVLPVVVMVYGSFAFLSRFTRANMLEVLGQDYVRTARAKGLAMGVVIWRHGLRNALIPLITLIGTLLPELLGGSVIIEEIFNIPGMGLLSFESLKARDYTTIMGIATISAGLTLISLFLADLAYKWADPRITFEKL